MATRQLLVFFASVAFLLLWTFGWGVLATGSLRGAFAYLLRWLKVIRLTAIAAAVCFLIVWAFIG